MRTTILVNTFNRAHLLRLALASYLRQTVGDFEIIVADDGSTDETPQVVAAFQKEAPFPVHYVRHEHEGHRRAAILNRGLERSSGDQVLFTDCDSLAFSNLVEVHLAHARPDRLLCGGYVRLSKEETEKLVVEDARSGRFEELLDLKKKLVIWRKHLKASWEILRRKPRRPHNMGLNYSVSREALFKINGYDEEFTGWGSADGDVRERLRQIAVRPVSLYHEAIVLHMWHPVEETKKQRSRNRAYANRPDVPTVCRRGIIISDAGTEQRSNG